MTESDDKVEFSFGWFALKLLGQNLYSNSWAAISELVANGFDAGAEDVYVHIDISDKKRARIEILDNGSGMDLAELRDYAKVGRNRRKQDADKTNDSDLIMGRKGIGKLAALYLSENYYLVTKTANSRETAWHMNYFEKEDSKEEKPFLNRISVGPDISCKDIWGNMKKGTLLQMNDVNLKGLGDKAYESLKHKLSNYFSLNSMGNRRILLRVLSEKDETTEFEVLTKKIAFGNMAFIDYNPEDSEGIISSLKIDEGKRVLCAYPKIKDKLYEHELNTEEFGSVNTISLSGKTPYKGVYVHSDGKEYQYELKGWVGIHASIDSEIAERNDKVFTRNKFYNPIQIRLYVRNKLAIENYLNVINLNQAFVNFVEGEVSFNILDHSDLPDIATTNRQSFDENDPRMMILTGLLKKVIGDLLRKREQLGIRIRGEQDGMIATRDSTAKKAFSNVLQKQLTRVADKDSFLFQEVHGDILSEVKGDVAPKDSYKLFISYCRYDKCISDFFFELLLSRDVRRDEIFYTGNKDFKDLRPLGKQIRDNIIKDNVLMFFITGSDFRRSELGLFEGGAGWATKTVGDYIILSVKYDDIPGYLSNDKAEYTLLHNGTLALGRESYPMVVAILNQIIRHVNIGRRISMESTIEEFDEEKLPSDIEVSRSGKPLDHFMDKNVLEYWNHYVMKDERKYLDGVNERNERAKQIDPERSGSKKADDQSS